MNDVLQVRSVATLQNRFKFKACPKKQRHERPPPQSLKEASGHCIHLLGHGVRNGLPFRGLRSRFVALPKQLIAAPASRA